MDTHVRGWGNATDTGICGLGGIHGGAPAKPMEPEISAAISSLVDGIPEIIEAHLPHVFVSDAMEAPGQVLVIVTSDRDVGAGARQGRLWSWAHPSFRPEAWTSGL